MARIFYKKKESEQASGEFGKIKKYSPGERGAYRNREDSLLASNVWKKECAGAFRNYNVGVGSKFLEDTFRLGNVRSRGSAASLPCSLSRALVDSRKLRAKLCLLTYGYFESAPSNPFPLLSWSRSCAGVDTLLIHFALEKGDILIVFG